MQAHYGGMGIAFAVRQDKSIDFADCPWGRHVSWWGYQTVVACGPRLVRGGRPDVDARRDGFRDPHVLGSNARTAVGVTADRHLLIAVVPGAMTLRTLATVLSRHAVREAINLDGGASTCLYYKGQVVLAPSRQLANVLTLCE